MKDLTNREKSKSKLRHVFTKKRFFSKKVSGVSLLYSFVYRCCSCVSQRVFSKQFVYLTEMAHFFLRRSSELLLAAVLFLRAVKGANKCLTLLCYKAKLTIILNHVQLYEEPFFIKPTGKLSECICFCVFFIVMYHNNVWP